MSSACLQTELLRDASDFVRYWHQIEALRLITGEQDDVLLNPVDFLAATDGCRRSCSVLCWNGKELLGLLYAAEHYVCGLRSGYAIGGDFVGRGLLLCRSEDEDEVLAACIDELLRRGLHSLHLRLSPRSYGHTKSAAASIKYMDAVVPGDRMSLPSNYEDFLMTLGKHTRRNVRHYTRKSLAEGIEFVPCLSKSEYQSAVERLNAVSRFPATAAHLARDERLLDLHSGCKRMGLMASNGKMAAVVCGFSRERRFHLLTQINDMRAESLSLSAVLRGEAVRHLIATGHTELQFMGGASLTFGRFCSPRPYRSIFVDKKGQWVSFVKEFSRRLVDVSALLGVRAPSNLEAICNGRLKESRIANRTAVGLSSIAFSRN